MRIVVGYDGSEPAKRALAHAVALAGPDDAVVVVVAVAEIHARPVLAEGALLDPSEIQQRRRESRRGQGVPGGARSVWCGLDVAAEGERDDQVVPGARELKDRQRRDRGEPEGQDQLPTAISAVVSSEVVMSVSCSSAR
jgi:nucleotide-binding universal stress UspA family protein